MMKNEEQVAFANHLANICIRQHLSFEKAAATQNDEENVSNW